MKHPKLRKELFLAIGFSILYLLVLIFNFHLDKFLPGLSVDLIRKILFLLLAVLFVIQIFKIFRRRRKSKGRIKLRFVFYLPSIILALSMLYTFAPRRFDSQSLESKIVLQGCYEQGPAQAMIHFRENKNFELRFKETDLAEWYNGTYIQKKDTLFLTYFEKNPSRFGSVVLNTGQTLMTLDAPHKLESYIQFHVGPCKTD